jgi:branched-chain amino acid transport system substrate-binding protein
MSNANPRAISRRRVVKSGLALAGARIAGPFVLSARAAQAVKIGLDNPLTGSYAALGKNELTGRQMALDEINARGGILGRPVELVVEDSTSGDAGVAVLKARKLIEGAGVDFLLGNVNSALSLAMTQVSNEKSILHIVPGGHTDAVTGSSCNWNVFRVCNTTQMEANAVAAALIEQYGKRFYYITADYAFGHTLEAGMVRASAPLGGERVGGDLTPVGTVDFSSYLIKAQAANPDVVLFLLGGDDMLNALKQAVQFGLQNKVHLAGAQQEMEPLEGLAPEARIGVWVMEWYWNQPGVSMSPNSSRRPRNAPAGYRPLAPGSAMSRSGPARSPPRRRIRSRRSIWRRPCRTFICRPKSRSGRTRPSTAPARISCSLPCSSARRKLRVRRRTTFSRSPGWSTARRSRGLLRRAGAR